MQWAEASLGSICDDGQGLIKTGPFGSQLHQSDYSVDGIPVVMPKDIVGGRLVDFSIARVSQEHIDRLAHHKLKAGDIVYGRRGDIGRCALIRERESGWLCGTGCLRVSLGKGDVLPQYLFYYLNDPSVVAWISNQAVGATMPNLNTGILRSIPVRYPPKGVQNRIVSILSAYDDLIENNTRRIEILEEMARRLYEEWFVQFRFPGHEGVKFKESELGLIPEDWDFVPLGDIYRTGSGGTPSRKNPEFYGSDYRWVKTKELQDCPVFDTEERISEEGLKKSSAKLFPRNTVLIAMYGATIGRLGVLQEESATNQACCAILPNSQGCGWGYAYLSLFSRRQALIDLRAGAAQQNISQDVIKKFRLLRASDEVHEQFEMAVTPFLTLCFALYRKNANLRAQRDLLLPKLISGEIDVSDIPMPT